MEKIVIPKFICPESGECSNCEYLKHCNMDILDYKGKTILILDEGEKVYTEKDMQDIHAATKIEVGLAKQRVVKEVMKRLMAGERTIDIYEELLKKYEVK